MLLGMLGKAGRVMHELNFYDCKCALTTFRRRGRTDNDRHALQRAAREEDPFQARVYRRDSDVCSRRVGDRNLAKASGRGLMSAAVSLPLQLPHDLGESARDMIDVIGPPACEGRIPVHRLAVGR